jgi:carboxyl-terminal processing protease
MVTRQLSPKINFSTLRRSIFSVVIILGVFSGGYLLGNKNYHASLEKFPKVTISRELPPEKQDLDFSLFWRVWDTLEAKYFDKSKLVPSQMVYGAIKGMVAALGDPYTSFLTPEENKVVQEDLRGSFEGVGIQIGFKGSQLAVIAPLPNTPAEKVGLKAGDYIVGIEDKLKGVETGTAGISLPEAVQIIRGPKGTTVTLTILREGEEEPITVDIVRGNIDVPTIMLSYVGDEEDVALVKLIKFTSETQDEWENTVLELLKKPELRGIIIDLRNNPGGFLQGAVNIASEFLDSGTVVVIEEQADGFKNEFKVDRIGRLRNTGIVVIVNGGSASASEILAGALRDQKHTPIVGEVTFGKGTIQEPQEIEGGAGLHITIARWLTPSEQWVNEGGLEPDVQIEDNPETPEDEQLQEAIRFFD